MLGREIVFVADTKSGAIIFDGGSSSEDQVGRYRILPYNEISGVSEDSDCGDQSYGISIIILGSRNYLRWGKLSILGFQRFQKMRQ